MRLKFPAFICFFAVAAFFISCKEGVKEFNVKESKRVSVTTSASFSLVLPEDHAAGQTWSVIENPNPEIAAYKGSSYRGQKSGLTDFLFESKNSGETGVMFRLVEYSHPVDTLHVTIIVE